jgi:hypothetical protein
MDGCGEEKLARTAEELVARESSGGAAMQKSCGGARDGCGGREGTVVLENSASRRLGFGARRIEKKMVTDVQLKRLRSAFHAMTGRDGRLTRRDGARPVRVQ